MSRRDPRVGSERADQVQGNCGAVAAVIVPAPPPRLPPLAPQPSRSSGAAPARGYVR